MHAQYDYERDEEYLIEDPWDDGIYDDAEDYGVVAGEDFPATLGGSHVVHW